MNKVQFYANVVALVAGVIALLVAVFMLGRLP